MGGDAATEVISELPDEGVEGERGGKVGGGRVQKTFVPIASRALEKTARKNNLTIVVVIGSWGSANKLA